MESKGAFTAVQVRGSRGKDISRVNADFGMNFKIGRDLRHSADAMLNSFNDVRLRLQTLEAGSDLSDSVARIARLFEDVHRDIIGLVSTLEAPCTRDRPEGDRAN